MAQGFLVSCVPSETKRPKKPNPKNLGAMVRLLRNEQAVTAFIKRYVDPKDRLPLVVVKVFNSNGYFEREFENGRAVEEFVPEFLQG